MVLLPTPMGTPAKSLSVAILLLGPTMMPKRPWSAVVPSVTHSICTSMPLANMLAVTMMSVMARSTSPDATPAISSVADWKGVIVALTPCLS